MQIKGECVSGENVAKQLIALRVRAGLSRNQLAVLAGYARGTSLTYYERVETWTERKFPLDFVARVSRALVGRGSPMIVDREIWALAESSSDVIVTNSPIVAVPVLEWSALIKGRSALKVAIPIAVVEAVGLGPGNYVAVQTPQALLGGVVPKGSHLILDADDIELRDGRRYVIAFEGAVSVRRYYSNPARFESESAPPDPTIFPSGPVEIVARIMRMVIDF